MPIRINLMLSDLCDEIDSLTEEVLYWKRKYEEENKKYNNLLDRNIKGSWSVSLGMLALATKDRKLAEKIATAEE